MTATRQSPGARTVAAVVTLLVMLALWPAAAHANQHQRTAEPPSPRTLALACSDDAVPDAGFTDVPAGSPHARAVDCAAAYGIARGGPGNRPANQFGPGLDVRRDQVASFIARFIDDADEQIDAALLPEWDGQNRFVDVSANSPHVAAINRLAAAAVVTGGPGGRPANEFGPAQPARRDQMASFINRSLEAILPEPLSTTEVYFDDLEGVVADHAANINVLAEERIVAGRQADGQWLYAPAAAVRRDQMASFLMRGMDLLVELDVVAPREPGPPAEPRTSQSYIQAPQEVITAQPGHTFEIDVVGFDEPGNPAPVHIALFPCDVAAPADPDHRTFRDDDGDGHADGIGTTDTLSARITRLHGTATDTAQVPDVNPGEDPQIAYAIHSDAPDCTIPVVFHDANDNDQLDVDAEGQPLEHWNYTERAWE